MANKRFEMFEYRNIVVRMRQGDSDRALAKAGLIGRPKAKALRVVAAAEGWLDPDTPLPDESVFANVLGASATKKGGASSVEPYRSEVARWAEQGIQCRTIYQALVRQHQYAGSYSSVHRFVRSLELNTPKATCHLDFAPGEAAQVDFGSGPVVIDTRTGEELKTWFFLMTLCWSRHQYAEIVLNQKVDTWLECHRHAFEWFNGVVGKITIDYVPGNIINVMCPPPLCAAGVQQSHIGRFTLSVRQHNYPARFRHNLLSFKQIGDCHVGKLLRSPGYPSRDP